MSTIYASDMRRTKTVYIESTHKPTQPRGNLYWAIIKGLPIIENFILVEPLLRGHLP